MTPEREKHMRQIAGEVAEVMVALDEARRERDALAARLAAEIAACGPARDRTTGRHRRGA